MSANKTNSISGTPITKEQVEREQMEAFVEKYQALCEEYKLQIVVTPAYKSRDDGTFSTVLQTSIGKMPQN